MLLSSSIMDPDDGNICRGVSKEAQQALIDNQLHHIEAMLNESTISIRPRWLLVAGHYPIFSAGGNGDTLELQSTLLPLLQRHQVHAYLCGHDHISEHLTYEDMHFFVAGAGSMTDKLGAGSNLAQLQWYGIYYSAFGFVEARTDRLTIGYVDINGTMRYNYSLLNPHQVDRADEPPLGPPKGPFGDAKDDIETSHVISTAVVMMGMFCFAVYVFWGRKKGDGEEKVMTKKKCESTGDKAVDRKAEKRALQYSMAVVAQDEWDLEEQRGKSSPLAQQNAGKTARLQRFLGRRGEAAQRSPLVTEPRCKYQAIAEPEAMEENNSTATVSKRDITIAGQPTRCNRTLGPQLDDQWLEQGDTEVTAVSEEEECQEQEENVASVATESFLLQSNPLFAGSSYITTDDIPSPTRNNISPNPSNSPSRSHRRCHTSPM